MNEETLTAHSRTRRWAAGQINVLAGGDTTRLPEYGSPAWLALPADDPRRVAAILTAAEAWRGQVAHDRWLDELYEEDTAYWLEVVTRDANDYAQEIAPKLARISTAIEQDNARQAMYQRAKARPLVVTRPGEAVAIPGRPGWWRHNIDGQQVDLPYNDVHRAEIEKERGESAA